MSYFSQKSKKAKNGTGKKNLNVIWHALPVEETFKILETVEDGLNEKQVEQRRQEFGYNLLPAKKPPTLLIIFLRQFLSPLIYILLAAGVVSVFIGESRDAIFIFAVLLLNAVLGTFQEWKAEKNALALQKLLKIKAHVKRGGVQRQLAAEELVPGDLVFLESGNKVPADIRLISANNLTIDESLLTGESLPVGKNAAALKAEANLSERLNMTFAGSTAVSGRGRGIVVATALQTELGKIAESVMTAEAAKPPLLIRMDKFARQISFFMTGACLLVGGVLLAQGMSYKEVFFLSVALAVSAIPEGLPVALTVALSIGSSRMARRNVIVRKLTAVESLGSCTVIASDKTGTLTVNQQTAKLIYIPSNRRFTVSGEGYNGEGAVLTESDKTPSDQESNQLKRLGIAAILCNESDLRYEQGKWIYRGDAIDVALLALGYKLGLDPQAVRGEYQMVGEIPYESEQGYAADFYRDQERVLTVVKGAVEVVLNFCREMFSEQGDLPLDRNLIEKETLALSENGYRVLAIADGYSSGKPELSGTPYLRLLGLAAFIDPLRAEAKAAVEKCKGAGVQVKMITGDHPATAFAIARDLGIVHSPLQVINSRELETFGGVDDPRFSQAVKSADVFARVTPLQKFNIVDSLIRSGHFLAVTGDGVNDAPALRKANIGVAMGSGTDLAKDSASMIIVDDNFASIVAGIEEGRFAYDNVRKVIYLLISTGAAEIILFALVIAFKLPLPLFPVQLLWLNLVTNGIQDVALAFEGGEPGTMSRPPRKPQEGIFNPLMVQETVVSGLTMGLLAFGCWYWLLQAGYDEFMARNIVLMLMVLLENFHIFNCRSEYVSAFRVPFIRNPLLILGLIAAQGIHILAMHLPFMQKLLRIAPVTIKEWLLLLSLASVILVMMEIFKKIKGSKRG
ncbi:MAG: HAD-IC family P-type ATPase [Elusimicrobiota bacterium]